MNAYKLKIGGNGGKMKLLGNIIWFIFGGIYMGSGWFLAGLLMIISIIWG
jgi:hypothetical protein